MQQNCILQLSIIIINYNVKYFLEQCLCSLLKAADGIDCEILVFDNASTDGSKDYLSEKFPQVHFHWLSNNLGFGKANNLAMQKAKGDFILLLNPDTIIAEDCLKNCLNYFTTSPNCGALGVRMIDGSGRFLKESKRGFPSLSNSFFKFSGLCKLFPQSKIFSGYYVGHLPENKSNRVDVLAGAFMMLTKKAVELSKGFDEDYFMYGEDVDLSYRIHQAGMENHYFAGTTIIHFKGESSQRFSKNYVHYFYNAMHIYVNKFYQNRKIQKALMHVFISTGKLLAGITIALRKLLSKPGNQTLSTAVVATQQEFNQILQLIKFASNPLTICGRIAPAEDDKEANIGNWKNIRNIVIQKKINLLLFCEGDNSYKNIIEQAQEIKLKYGFLIHGKGSNSIVESHNKNNPGIVIAKI